jgi:uncharacterized protein (TIGR02611 family)
MRLLRRIGIAVGGGAVLLVGIVMIVLPGPAILVIPSGLAILALEFAWARHLLQKMKSYLPKRGEAKKPEVLSDLAEK